MLPPVSRPSDWPVRRVHQCMTFDHRHIHADYARATVPSQVKARRCPGTTSQVSTDTTSPGHLRVSELELGD
jgi:hypothetical protein